MPWTPLARTGLRRRMMSANNRRQTDARRVRRGGGDLPAAPSGDGLEAGGELRVPPGGLRRARLQRGGIGPARRPRAGQLGTVKTAAPHPAAWWLSLVDQWRFAEVARRAPGGPCRGRGRALAPGQRRAQRAVLI